MKRANLQRQLGSTYPAGTSQIVLFIPACDRAEKAIDKVYWRDQDLETFGRLFRGASAFPPSKGVWRDDAAGGKLIFEETTIVISYINPSDFDDDAIARLRNLLHRMGRKTNQGEVGAVIDGVYYGISEYDM